MIKGSYLREKEKYKIIVKNYRDRCALFDILECTTGTFCQKIEDDFTPYVQVYIEAWLTEDELLMLKLRSSIKFEYYRMGL